eukprot:scaffold7453_cov177-Amphora_coffeaeformis.AAC.6
MVVFTHQDNQPPPNVGPTPRRGYSTSNETTTTTMIYESLRGMLFGEKMKKFGSPGKAEKEKKCPEFRAYLYCQGHLSTEKRSAILPANSTLQDTRNAFGRPMRQQKICDEELHEINNTSEPLWKRSTDCNISLVFQYKSDEERKMATQATKTMLRDGATWTKDGVETLWRRVTTPANGDTMGGNQNDAKDDRK